ncbi:unnamed protein product [Rotaria sp. Silwood2]|nr:unnamed protein product [Rotaria sp. Silwood2]CAF2888241.1 unnamed protein product [Rotaria sp. Silwood2]CAF4234502.1 unnamed protein product [Rotaria sp. Silwood2]CAF4399620.1 unnamed protein product [Rotaria sp. Silwood2]
MPQLCAIEKCTRKSRWLCDCCKQNICLQHLNEHNISLISQLNPLTDEINVLGVRLKTLNIQKIIDNNREKLEQWRQDCYKKIDCLFEQKCQELDQLINEKVDQQRQELNRIHLRITELINTQETTRQEIDRLSSTIRQLERNMNNSEETCFTIDTRPLLIDDTFISIKKSIEKELDLSTLSPASTTIHRPNGSSGPLTCNDQYILVHQHPNICLFNQEMNIIKHAVWSYGRIWDMCWSSTLNRFIVLGRNNIYLINENTMSINNVYTSVEHDFISCTCSNTLLFACTNNSPSSILEFTLCPTIEIIREWRGPLTCAKDEIIDDMVYNNETLALMIKNKSERPLRMELRYAKMLDRIWALQMDMTCVCRIAFRCCSLTCNEWLIVDYESGRLLQITRDGKIKKTMKYNPSPHRAILFNSNQLAISTGKHVNLHTIQ